MNNRIPKHLIEHHKQGVEELKFYGHAATDLDRDELLALANCLAQTLKLERERLLANLEMFKVFRNARP